MDPQLMSALTSLGMFVSASLATLAVSKGVIPASAQGDFANNLIAVGSSVSTLGLWYWKTRVHTPKAIIAAVNDADNGVKVVSATAPVPQVNAPLK